MEGREYNPHMNPETNRNASAAAHSPWHSPVPYLFGGLAAMLGLIAFALLILACSYWRLSGYLDGGSGDNPAEERDLEAGDDGGETKKSPAPLPEKFLVIMAGDVKPTYLATPASNSNSTSRSSSFMETDKSCTCGDDDDDDDEEEKKKEGQGSDQVTRQSTGGNGEPTEPTSVQTR